MVFCLLTEVVATNQMVSAMAALALRHRATEEVYSPIVQFAEEVASNSAQARYRTSPSELEVEARMSGGAVCYLRGVLRDLHTCIDTRD